MSISRVAVSSILALAGLATAANAQVVTLSDRNTSSVFAVTGGSQIGWVVDGVNQLFNQRFFYRVAGASDETAVDATNLLYYTETDTNAAIDSANDTLTAVYADNNNLAFEIKYSLQGTFAGGSADLGEQISIFNFGSTTTRLSFFQYVDFDLNGEISNDFAQIEAGRVAIQNNLNGANVTETVVAPRPTRYQVGLYPSIADSFFDGVPTTLTNFAGPIVGDATWAFQWDITLLPGQTYQISKDKLVVVPTPGAAVLGLAGVAALGRRRRA